jgi:nucleotide-binding universal stress UspA family protein
MSGRENEAVPVGPEGITRVELEKAIPECVGHGRRAQRQPGMPGVGLLHHVHGQEAERVDTEFVQFGRSDASDLAQRFHAELYLLNVIPMLPMGTKTVSFPETEYLHKAEGNAERQLATCDAALVSKGIKASSSIEIGNDVVGNIMLAIEREHIDMIVISTHGISGWRPLVFGSIAEKVVKQVQCPLLLLRSVEPDATYVASTLQS